MKETDGKSARSGFFGAFGRRRTDPPILVEVPPERGNGVDENLPPGIRLAAAWSWRLLAVAGALAVLIFIVIQAANRDSTDMTIDSVAPYPYSLPRKAIS